MKKLLLLSLILSSSSLFAMTHPEPDAKGIEIVPLSKFNLSKTMMDKAIRDQKEYKMNGFVETKSDYPKYLFSITEEEKKTLLNPAFHNDFYDTHIKPNLSQIKLNFPFQGIRFLNKFDVIGYAPIGTWEDNGWTGIKEFFKHKEIGTCSYALDTIVFVRLDKDTARYDVNNKPTNINVEGNKQDGFLYRLSWFEEKSNGVIANDLECANMKFDQTITKKMIDLARLIDKSV